jgi:hypothetical protein
MKQFKILPIYLVVLCFAFSSKSVAQRNTLSFSYTPAVTKLDIENFSSNNGIGSSWQIHYESKANDMPAFGYNIGFYYNHRFKRLGFGLGVLLTKLRQQSGIYYQWKGLSSYPIDYAGTNYVSTYESVELPLVFDYLVKEINKFSLSVELALSINAMVRFRIEDYIVEQKSGIYRKGCCTTSINRDNQTFETLKFIINNNRLEYIRIGYSTGFRINYSVFKNLSVSLMPTVKYYSKSLKEADNTFSLKADALLFGTQLNLNVKF